MEILKNLSIRQNPCLSNHRLVSEFPGLGLHWGYGLDFKEPRVNTRPQLQWALWLSVADEEHRAGGWHALRWGLVIGKLKFQQNISGLGTHIFLAIPIMYGMTIIIILNQKRQTVIHAKRQSCKKQFYTNRIIWKYNICHSPFLVPGALC